MRAKLILAALLFLFANGIANAQTPVPQAPNPAPASSASQSPANEPIRLTQQQAEAIGLQKNPQITIGRLRALQAQQFVRETRSALLPTAYLSLTAVDSEAGSRIAAGALNNPVIFPRAAAGATVSQLISDFGRSTNLLSSSENQAKAEDKNAVATAADITLAVDQAFYSALETRELVKVAQQTVETRQTLVDRIQALTQAKLRSDLDLSFANVDLSRAKLLLIEAQNNYQGALAALSAVLGYPDQQNFALIEASGQVLAPPPADVVPLVAQAMQQRPELASLQFQMEAAQKNANAEHDLWRPTVSALGVAGLVPVRDPNVQHWYGAVGVNVNIPVFNGFLFNARAKSADLQTEQARQRLLDLKNNIARAVRVSWQDAGRAYARLEVTQQMRQQAGLAMDLAQQRYNLGLSSIVEYSQTVLAKTEADIADTDARYQYQLSEIVLAYVTATPR